MISDMAFFYFAVFIPRISEVSTGRSRAFVVRCPIVSSLVPMAKRVLLLHHQFSFSRPGPCKEPPPHLAHLASQASQASS